jgi:hypothetical protein
LVFWQAWEGKSYPDIAKAFDYNPGYIKDTGSKLWQKLLEIYGVKVTKHTFQSVLPIQSLPQQQDTDLPTSVSSKNRSSANVHLNSGKAQATRWLSFH